MWVLENFDALSTIIPRSYPRVLQHAEMQMRSPLALSSVIIASLTVLIVTGAMVLTYQQRARRALKQAQLGFLWLLLAGLGLVSSGSLLLTLPSSDISCVISIWLTNLGYTLELVPLIVKMAAISQLVSAAKKMRHAVMSRKKLYGIVSGLSFVMVIFLLCWTTIDPPRKDYEYELTKVKTNESETIVESTCFCKSNSGAWRYTSIASHFGMLLMATIQTILVRKVRKEINESRTLGIMIYSHLMFLCARIMTLFLEDSLNRSSVARLRSILYSLDSIAVVTIYFLPKFLAEDKKEGSREVPLESETVKQLRMLAAVATAQHERRVNPEKEEQIKEEDILHGSRSLRVDTRSFMLENIGTSARDLADSVEYLNYQPKKKMNSIMNSKTLLDETLEEDSTEKHSSLALDMEEVDNLSEHAHCQVCGDVISTCPRCGETAVFVL